MDAPGKSFEEDVRHLLRLQGWHITAEKLLGHKKVDAYAERTAFFGTTERVAIECKDHAGCLTQHDVTAIYANYLPLLEANDIDQIVLVTRKGISPTAEAYSGKTRRFVHVTYLSLLNSLLDLSAYVHGMISQFSSGGLDRYYVPQRCEHASEALIAKTDIAENTVMEWVLSDDFRPIAILAGYGMGKTTLARRLAFLLASEHLQESPQEDPDTDPA